MTNTVIEDVDLKTLKAGLANGSIVLIDVREANEWDSGHIRGAKHNALSRFDVGAIPVVSGKKIVLHCRSGKRSASALAAAQAAGRQDVCAHFGGGMLAWQAAGEPLER
ncbi:MAG: rhodanese-like domain-containing protein [Hyphomicrobiales bacterium]|nr:rhodanese-like domain-containing protein [Hyphomicrobiales bacterium]MDE2116188.1 rhodanese-like domain-containing protein [Hyphomicrobiales bacterium]